MMLRVFFILSMVVGLSACGTLPTASTAPRDPSSVASWQNLPEVQPEPVEWRAKEKEGAEQPWLFTDGYYSCAEKTLPLDMPSYAKLTPLQLENPNNPLVQSWVKAVNQRTFRYLSCSERFKGIVNDLFQAFATPEYHPKMTSDSEGNSWASEYTVLKLESMIFLTRSKATIKNLVQAPKYENPERTKPMPLTNEPILEELGVANHGNLEFRSYVRLGWDRCTISVQNVINRALIDQFITSCSSNGRISVAPISLRGELYALYTDLVYNSQAQLQAPYYVIKLHKVTKTLSPRVPLERYWSEQVKEPVIVTLDGGPSGEPSQPVMVPYGIAAAVDEAGNQVRLVVNSLLSGRSTVSFFTLRADTLNVLAKSILESGDGNLLTIESVGKQKAVLGQSSKQNDLQYFSYDYKTEKTEVLSKAYRVRQGPDYLSEVLLYPTKDGRRLPVTVTYSTDFKKGRTQNFGVAMVYGGSNTITQLPDSAKYQQYDGLLRKGGFVAAVTVRGGGELGGVERATGFGRKVQTSFDDYQAAVEFLYREGFAGPRRIVSLGWSFGGLAVLVSGFQRPDLFGAVIAGSPVTDPLNIGRSDGPARVPVLEPLYFDRLSNPEVREYWNKNAPVVLAKTVQNPPPILLRTSFGDLNVAPSASFKLFKILQSRRDREKFHMFARPFGSGHGPKSSRHSVEEFSYFESFIYRTLNIP